MIHELQSLPEPPDRWFTRRAQRFDVGVYDHQLRQLQKCGAITLVHERFWVLTNNMAYDSHVGLRLDSAEFRPEQLCF